MKRNFFVLLLLVGLTFPAWKALRHPGMISGHDTESAVFKAGEFFQALKDGHFPPRWAKRLDYGLGQPTFTFTYTAPYYLTSVLMAGGLSAEWSVKILLAASFPVSAFFVFLWLKNKFGGTAAAVTGLIYTYAPYHFANVYVRGAIGEVTAAAILPLSFWALDRKNPALASLVIMLVILSHPFYGLVFAPVWVLYVRGELKQLAGIGWGYLNSAFYIIPAAVYRHLTYLDGIEEYFLEKQVFVDLGRLFYSPWGFAGVHETQQGPMSVQIGAVLLVFFLGGLILIAKKKADYHLKYFTALALGAVFMMMPASLGIWKILSPLMSMQFPWRMLFVVNIAGVFCAGYFLHYLIKVRPGWKIPVLAGVTAVTILAGRGFWKVERYYYYEDKTIEAVGYPGTLTLLLEETPRWHDPRQEANPYNFGQNALGRAETITSLVWKTNYHKFEVVTRDDIWMSDKTHYWPGWEARVDGEKVEIKDPYDPISRGLVTLPVPSGRHIVETKLTEPLLNKIANGISLASIGLALGIVIRSKYETAKI